MRLSHLRDYVHCSVIKKPYALKGLDSDNEMRVGAYLNNNMYLYTACVYQLC